MKRTKIASAKRSFIKTGKGTFRLANGKKVKPNEVFQAYPEDIPEAFRDVIKPYGQDKQVEEVFQVTGKVEDPTPIYSIQETDSVGWWNVVDSQGKVVNENKLRKNDAEELVNQLNA